MNLKPWRVVFSENSLQDCSLGSAGVSLYSCSTSVPTTNVSVGVSGALSERRKYNIFSVNFSLFIDYASPSSSPPPSLGHDKFINR